ncbi:NmrA-like family protein [Xylona heveae TC161]|uniref:NmrA-like family protein n=1 Tax=Xylona heveae (strain CBS 132557 / TC161) TaxID=1328760 RepID=A0A165A268_XYLHT|nr:NmrA-like family protein [Xylona heveae TC161]KZF19850.1 NmrA-like family protein [Xylona heveae TC161]
MTKVAIFPASGKLGTSIYTYLLTKIDPKDLILISRNPDKTPKKYVDAGVTLRRADYDFAESLERAFDHVDCLVLISYPTLEDEIRFTIQKRTIDAARRSSVSHIFYTSLAFGGDCTSHTAAHVMRAHLKTENYLHSLASDDTSPKFTYTSIREGLYAESWPMYTGFFNIKDESHPSDEIRIPHDGSGPGIAWAKLDELGEASAELVREYLTTGRSNTPFRYTNKVMLLSGPRAYSLNETAEILGKIKAGGVKQQVRVKEISVDEYAATEIVREEVGSHAPKGREAGEPARKWATVFEAIRKGETEVTAAEELERLLGRKPTGFEDVVRESLV